MAVHPLHPPLRHPALPSLLQARMAIHQAAKANDLAAALAAFDQAKADGLKLGADLYVSLLYLCGGGDGWEEHLQRRYDAGAAADAPAAGQHQEEQQQQQEAAGTAAGSAAGEAGDALVAAAAVPAAEQAGSQAAEQAEGSAAAAADAPPAPLPQPDAAERLRRAEELFAEMKGSGGRLPLNEMCFTALARLAAQRGDADRAFELAQASRARGCCCAWRVLPAKSPSPGGARNRQAGQTDKPRGGLCGQAELCESAACPVCQPPKPCAGDAAGLTGACLIAAFSRLPLPPAGACGSGHRPQAALLHPRAYRVCGAGQRGQGFRGWVQPGCRQPVPRQRAPRQSSVECPLAACCWLQGWAVVTLPAPVGSPKLACWPACQPRPFPTSASPHAGVRRVRSRRFLRPSTCFRPHPPAPPQWTPPSPSSSWTSQRPSLRGCCRRRPRAAPGSAPPQCCGAWVRS